MVQTAKEIVQITIRRQDPEVDNNKPYYQDYNVEVEDWFTVLDALIKIREQMDGTLSLRCACRASICGSCAMRVNGQAKLVCKTKLTSVLKDNKVTVEPVGNMPVITDLTADFKPFWDKMHAVDPYLKPEEEAPEAEYIAPNEDMVHLVGVMNCIMCGACVSDCTVLEVKDNFLGPAALAKAYRFVADPRDDTETERLENLVEDGGIWDCTRCMQCVEVCPKDVDPMDRIMAMRANSLKKKMNKGYGARHANAFTSLVKSSGILNETLLILKTKGFFNIIELIKLLPLAIAAQLAGKRPPFLSHSIKNKDKLKNIFKKLEKK